VGPERLDEQTCRGLHAVTGTDRLVVVQQLQDPEPPQVLTRHRSAGQQGTHRGSSITMLDKRTNKVKARITVGYAPDGPILDASNRRLYVPEFDEGSGHSVYVIDTTSNKVLSTIDVGKGPQFPVLDSVSNRLYVPNFVSGTVSVVNTKS
jgi:YVTN family beta-propeller protein